MADFEIYVDSGANIPNALAKEHNIHVVPFTFLVNGEERSCSEEGVDFSVVAKQFYNDMRAGAEIKTSLIPAARFISELTPALEAGKDALLFTISSGISGTNNQAKEAKRVLEEQFPHRKVYVLDSANASMGEGLLSLRAADLRDMGESAKACAEWVERNTYKMNSYLTVGDLKYLRKSGRISTTLAIAGTLLNIKPLLRADGGTNAKIVSYGKERGRKKALAALVKAFEEFASEPLQQRIAIMHADCEEDANELAERLRELGVSDIIIGYYDLCTGSHVGPGTVALFFMGKDRRSLQEKAPYAAPSPLPVPVK